ncbi:hypothetical protein AVEN_5337-1 [Araneus ventricosus]|uniref:Uncharacterized protein n=1 Tax=Araneus ventricosus TaxID=182803 RepID=A0A4Y2S4Q6_ARAVE|nr:hypothetical protein AVEN_5337-1 [Araneus ventricosus]
MTDPAVASSTEAGVLVTNHLATDRPLPKEVRSITGGVTFKPISIAQPEKGVPANLSGSIGAKSDFCLRAIKGLGTNGSCSFSPLDHEANDLMDLSKVRLLPSGAQGTWYQRKLFILSSCP